MGIGTLGFLKGASGTMLSSIEARDAAETELKKQKQLIKFRNDIELQNEMVKATTFQIEKDPETGKLRTVGYNSQGKRLDSTARDSTQSEIAAKLQEEEDRKYTLGERERKTRRDDQVYNFADEDQRMQRETHGLGLKATKAQIDAANRSGRSLDGSGSGKGGGMSSGSAGIADLLLNDYSEDIKAAGISADQARNIAMSGIVTLMSKKVKDPDILYSMARQSFESGISKYIRSMTQRGLENKDDTYTKFRAKRFSIDGSK